MIRATTGGVMKGYRSNLMNSFIGMNSARNTVLSQRVFNSYAEDPAAAAKAFRLRKSRLMVDSQHDICNDVLKKYDTAYACLQSIDEVLDTKDGQYGAYMKTLKGVTLSWLNDPTGDAREQLSKVLDQTSDLITQTMNQKYGDNFIFAGADGHNVPFEVKTMEDGTKKLFYRGISVDAAVPDVMTFKDNNGDTQLLEVNAGTNLMSQGGGSYIKMDTSALIKQSDFDDIIINDPTAQQPNILYKDAAGAPLCFNEKGEVVDPATYTGDIYYLNMDKAQADGLVMTTKDYDTACKDAEKLKYLANEKNYVDIGLGFKEDENGNLLDSSGFNAALPGISFLGYGVDEDGDPKNIYSIVQRLTEISDSVPEGGKWTDDVYDEFDRLVGKLETACSSFKTEFTNLAAGTTKLDNQEQLLVDNFDNLQEQYAALEDVDMVDSITSFIWAEYCYNAALKVGNSILSESLMDYLK
jgi:flagellar hook-associated protein 3 FlgL